LGYLARAVGPMLTRQMHDVLDLMFLCGLSDPLYASLKDIADHIPPLLRTVQDRLLETIAHALTGAPFRPLGAPAPSPRHAMANGNGHGHGFGSYGSGSGGAAAKALAAASSTSPEVQALALHILGTFDFTGHALNEFVRDAVLPFLEHDLGEVRQEAVLASTQLFIHDPICNQTSSHSIGIVNEVLEKLLTVGITDPGECGAVGS
jgi:FKBP12-rapamycin complex-associated protein